MVAARALRPSDTIRDGIDDAMKVLVIDDEPLLRDVLAEFLELLGHEPDLAADGPEGLARFDPLVHQIVLTDFLMPGLTGLQVAAAIRARGCRTPIVMISGFAKPDDEREAVAAGLRVVRKPLTFAQFEATMAAVVERVDAMRC
jgi:two-component system capsular synthesis sensor histidine kinase RcsC